MNMKDGLAAVPSFNLVQNLGLDDSGTNTEIGTVLDRQYPLR